MKWVYKRYSDDEACKPITDPAPTVVARHFFRWAFPNTGSKLILFSVGEMASLQTFSHGYFFGDKKRKAMRCVGNALPPLAATQTTHTEAACSGGSSVPGLRPKAAREFQKVDSLR